MFSAAYPVFVSIEDFDNAAQVEKINTIIHSQYNHYLQKTNQKVLTKSVDDNIIVKHYGNTKNIRSTNYNEYNTIYMKFSTVGMTSYNRLYQVFEISDGSIPLVNGTQPDIISYVGVDNEENWEDMLNNYGAFVFYYDKNSKKQQIGFRTYTKDILTDPDGNLIPIKEKDWNVYMTFMYQKNKE